MPTAKPAPPELTQNVRIAVCSAKNGLSNSKLRLSEVVLCVPAFLKVTPTLVPIARGVPAKSSKRICVL
jgi:hypothetical protein